MAIMQLANELMVKLFEIIIRQSAISENWSSIVIVPIFKRGAKIYSNNNRAICLLNTVLKLLTKIISETLTQQIGITEEINKLLTQFLYQGRR